MLRDAEHKPQVRSSKNSQVRKGEYSDEGDNVPTAQEASCRGGVLAEGDLEEDRPGPHPTETNLQTLAATSRGPGTVSGYNRDQVSWFSLS